MVSAAANAGLAANPAGFSAKALEIDCEQEAARICERIGHAAHRRLHRRGVVVGLSGGIDSSVCAALAARALGPQRVLGLLMPERESSSNASRLGTLVADHLGIERIEQDITPVLEAIGCYRLRDQAIRGVFPEYDATWRSKIVIAGAGENAWHFFRIVARAPDGRTLTKRLPAHAYLQIVAAVNFKQRIRKTLEYYHADHLNYAVLGTPNRLEYDQGFFVKNGDGAADIKPIAHLYKTQVYALARHLGLPQEICSAQPTTDTYSLPQGQDEFYFALSWQQTDLALWALNHGESAAALGAALGLSEAAAARAFADIRAKRTATERLHLAPLLASAVDEVGHATEQ
jgi:NAD+ synthase